MSRLPLPSPTLHAGEPLVSVIVPCFGEGRYLATCLASLSRQRYPHLQVIVIDDAGHDDSLAVALEHAIDDERIELYRTHHNVGLGAVRNIATTFARGDLLLFLDGDDWVPPNAISCRVERIAATLDEIDEASGRRLAGAFGQGQHTRHDADLDLTAPPSPRLTEVDLASSRGANVSIVSAPLVRRDLMLLSGGFAEGVAGAEDHLGWMRLLALGTVLVPCEEVVAFYRQKPQSMLRDSAETVAAFGIAARQWVPEVEPVRAGTAIAQRVVDGDFVMRWGRPRRSITRMAAAPPGATTQPAPPGPITAAEWPVSPPALSPSSPLVAGVERGTRLLLGDEQPARPDTTELARCGRWFHERAATPVRRAPTPVGSTITIGAVSAAAGVEAVALARRAPEMGLTVRLALGPRARAGALAAIASSSGASSSVVLGPLRPWEPLDLLVRTPGEAAAGPTARVAEVLDARAHLTPGAALIRARTASPAGAGPVLLVPARSSPREEPSAWLIEAIAETDDRVEIVALDAATARLLSDQLVPHRRGGLVDLSGATVICEDAATADFVALANPGALVGPPQLRSAAGAPAPDAPVPAEEVLERAMRAVGARPG